MEAHRRTCEIRVAEKPSTERRERRARQRETSSSTCADLDGLVQRHPRARGRLARHLPERGDGDHRPVRLRQEHVHPLLQPHERPDPERRGQGRGSSTTALDLYGPEVDPVEVRKRIGMVFQKPNPFPKSIYDNVAFGPARARLEEEPRRTRRARAQAGGALGRGQAPAQGERAQPLGRPAAAPLHRALPRRRARRDPHGRAGLRARPDLDDARSRTSCTSSSTSTRS